MVKINLNIQKKDLWLLSAIIVFLVAVGYVIATGSTPTVNGHSFGEIQMPSCTDGQILKDISGSWQCANDAKCDSSGVCSQVCIGVDCKNSWPSGIQATTCPAGQYVNAISSTGVVTCSLPYVIVASCIYPPSGITWSPGQQCCWGSTNYRYTCTSTGWWTGGSSCGSWPAC